MIYIASKILEMQRRNEHTMKMNKSKKQTDKNTILLLILDVRWMHYYELYNTKQNIYILNII